MYLKNTHKNQKNVILDIKYDINFFISISFFFKNQELFYWWVNIISKAKIRTSLWIHIFLRALLQTAILWILKLLNNPELCTSTSAVQVLFFFWWCDWSFCENNSIWSRHYLSYPSFFFFDFINHLPKITIATLPFSHVFISFNYIKKCLLHNSVLQTVKGYDSKPSTRCKTVKTRIERILKSLQFIIDSDSQCLKYPGCCFYPTLSPPCYSVIKICMLIITVRNFPWKTLWPEAWVKAHDTNRSYARKHVGQEWLWKENNMLDRVIY